MEGKKKKKKKKQSPGGKFIALESIESRLTPIFACLPVT